MRASSISRANALGFPTSTSRSVRQGDNHSRSYPGMPFLCVSLLATAGAAAAALALAAGGGLFTVGRGRGTTARAAAESGAGGGAADVPLAAGSGADAATDAARLGT